MGIIIKPIVTEKMTGLSEKLNRYGFKVQRDANKLEIKEAVEAMYNVTVTSVNTMVVVPRTKKRYTKSGVVEGRAAAYKSARISAAVFAAMRDAFSQFCSNTSIPCSSCVSVTVRTLKNGMAFT